MSDKIYNHQRKKEAYLVFDYIVNINYVKKLKESQQN